MYQPKLNKKAMLAGYLGQKAMSPTQFGKLKGYLAGSKIKKEK